MVLLGIETITAERWIGDLWTNHGLNLCNKHVTRFIHCVGFLLRTARWYIYSFNGLKLAKNHIKSSKIYYCFWPINIRNKGCTEDLALVPIVFSCCELHIKLHPCVYFWLQRMRFLLWILVKRLIVATCSDGWMNKLVTKVDRN